MTTLALIDGTNVVMRCASVMVDRPPVDVCRSADRMIGEFCSFYKATHCVVAFDGASSWRKAWEPTYKQSRTTDTRPWQAALRDYLSRPSQWRDHPLQCVEAEGFEADDVLATLATRRSGAGVATRILSTDSDLLVLSSLLTAVCRFGSKKDPAPFLASFEGEACSKYDVDHPFDIIVKKALVGETGDDVVGVPKVGPVTASKLIRAAKVPGVPYAETLGYDFDVIGFRPFPCPWMTYGYGLAQVIARGNTWPKRFVQDEAQFLRSLALVSPWLCELPPIPRETCELGRTP